MVYLLIYALMGLREFGFNWVAQWIAYLLPTLQPRIQIPAFPIFFSDEFLMLLSLTDGTVLKSGQRLDNVDQTHLVLASGKLVLQKL